jgi:hypothetical protein
MSADDSLNVSLHDGDLADELELTVRLTIATNEADGRLAQDEIDRILGVTPVRREPT